MPYVHIAQRTVLDSILVLGSLKSEEGKLIKGDGKTLVTGKTLRYNGEAVAVISGSDIYFANTGDKIAPLKQP